MPLYGGRLRVLLVRHGLDIDLEESAALSNGHALAAWRHTVTSTLTRLRRAAVVPGSGEWSAFFSVVDLVIKQMEAFANERSPEGAATGGRAWTWTPLNHWLVRRRQSRPENSRADT